ncbi:MAG: triose-phosphate isomerase, partial [Chloroflexota bacterium]
MEQIEHRNTARRAMTGTSWKMNLVPSAADAYLRELVPLVAGLTGPELFVLPAFPSIAVARDRLLGTGIAWGAQDVHPDEAGAHTGDVSAPMLADLGCRFVEVGHAERRRDHGETPALVAAKVRSIIRWGMEPIVCVGDAARTTPAEAIAGILADLALVVDGLDATGLARLVVAYEPVWAIGQGAAAAPPEV